MSPNPLHPLPFVAHNHLIAGGKILGAYRLIARSLPDTSRGRHSSEHDDNE